MFLHENRQLFFLARKYGPPLAMNESYAMGEIWRQKSTTASRICQNMRIEKSTLSRLVQSLKERGLVVDRLSENDRRTRFLALTAAGEELYSKNCRLRNLLVEEFGRNLSAEELERFFSYVKRMADNYGAAPESVESYGSAYRHQMGRLTKAMRIPSSNYLGCGIPISKFHILSLLEQSGGTQALYDLRRKLPYETSVVSRFIFGLEKANLISKSSAEFDRRHRHLKLSQYGRSRYAQYRAICEKEMAKGLAGMKPAEIRDFTALDEKICAAWESRGKNIRPAGGVVRRLHSLAELRRARAFLVQQLAASRRLDNLPETMLAGGNFCFVLYQGNVIQGVLEIGRLRKQWSILHFVIASNADLLGAGRLLMHSALKTFFHQHGNSSIIFPSAGMAAAFIREHFKDCEFGPGAIKIGQSEIAFLIGDQAD